MTRMPKPMAFSVGVLLAGSALLSGCAETTADETTSPGDGTMTPEAARDDLKEMLVSTQTAALGGSWVNEDDATPRTCTTKAGQDGVQFSFLRSREPGPANDAERTNIVEVVAPIWAAAGYSIDETEQLPGTVEVTVMAANNDELSSLSLSMSSNATTIYGGSSCVEGDYHDVLERLKNSSK
jgi:hypothetical protein